MELEIMTNKLDENATFIGGHRRGGTTLFLNLLEGHPQLSVFPVDSGFFYAYYPVYESPKYSNEDRINRIIEFSYGNIREEIEKVDDKNRVQFPFEALYQNFQENATKGNFTPKEMLLAMVSAYQQTYNKDITTHIRWVEKTTSSEIYAKYIFEWFPKSKFIHLIRDPRDNYSSLKSGWDIRYKARNDDPRRLLQSMIDRGKIGLELAKYNMERYGDKHYLVFKFEELVANPKAVMHRVCQYLEIEYADCLLRPTICGQLWEGNSFDGLGFIAPSSRNVNRWRERITEDEAKVIEYYFREIMEYFGYQPVFDINECVDAAVEHYKWYNYAKVFGD